jgi:hypothetical protein
MIQQRDEKAIQEKYGKQKKYNMMTRGKVNSSNIIKENMKCCHEIPRCLTPGICTGLTVFIIFISNLAFYLRDIKVIIFPVHSG